MRFLLNLQWFHRQSLNVNHKYNERSFQKSLSTNLNVHKRREITIIAYILACLVICAVIKALPCNNIIMTYMSSSVEIVAGVMKNNAPVEK